MAVFFKPEFHKYTSVDPTENIEWTSVTSFISKFKAPFDAHVMAAKCSKSKNSKWYGIPVEDIKTIWEKESTRATDLGTRYHNQRESELCNLTTIGRDGTNSVPVFSPIENEEGIRIAPNQKLQPGVYPEHMVYLKSVGLCGQSDYVEVIKDVVNIIDYKTNKEIKKESYKSWDGSSKKMLAPVSHLDDCNFWHYALQLSMYMYIIIKHNPLFRPGKMTLQHVIFEEVNKDKHGYPISAVDSFGEPVVKEVINYDVPYLKHEVIALINHLKNSK